MLIHGKKFFAFFVFLNSIQRGSIMVMARKAKVAKQDAQSKIILGRNFLDVSQFKKFLSKAKSAFDDKTYKGLKSCYERCMNGVSRIEVRVEGINDAGLAFCTFYCRGANSESLYASADCLTAIIPVPVKTHIKRDEFARLAQMSA